MILLGWIIYYRATYSEAMTILSIYTLSYNQHTKIHDYT